MQKSFNLFFIPEDNRRIRKFRLTEGQLRLAVGVLVASFLFVVFNTVGFWYYRSLYASLDKDRLAVIAYQKEKKDLAGKMEVLEKTVGETERMAGNLASLVGTERLSLQKGIGPIPPAPKPADRIQKTASLPASGLIKSGIDRLEERTLTLQMRIKELTKVQEDRLIYISSTPSIWPVKGWVTSDFGSRRSPFTFARDFHEGIDIAAQWGTPIIASADGVVTYAAYKGGLGKTVIIDHGFGVTSYYGHTSQILVHEGERIARGTTLALIGSTGHATGPHLHYEIHVDGVPVDPMKYILQ